MDQLWIARAQDDVSAEFMHPDGFSVAAAP